MRGRAWLALRPHNREPTGKICVVGHALTVDAPPSIEACSQAASSADFARCSSTLIVETRLSRRARRLTASSGYVG